MADKKPLVNDAGNAVEIATGDTIPIANGGTGATTANAALNALLPSQTGNSGEFLTTDGTDASWGAISLPSSFVGKSIAVYKGSNGSVTSSTTLQNDDDFSFSIAASETWKGSIFLDISAGGSGGFKCDFTVPSGASGSMAMMSSMAGVNIANVSVATGGGFTMGITAGRGLALNFTITNSTNAGTVQFRFAQNASNGTATTVRGGSLMNIVRTA